MRQDDADARLTERAYHIGLATKERYDYWLKKKESIERIVKFCENFSLKPALINSALEQLDTTPLKYGCKLFDVINRPQITVKNIAEHISPFKQLLESIEDRKDETIEAAEVLMKYNGYIVRERIIAEKMQRLENIKIKGRFDYKNMNSLSTEARQKLEKINPRHAGTGRTHTGRLSKRYKRPARPVGKIAIRSTFHVKQSSNYKYLNYWL